MDGGAGNDVITDGGSGTNVLRGGDGNDTITYDYTSNNTVEGGAGNDLIKVSSQNTGGYNTFTDTLRGGTGDDRIQSGEQADTYLFDRGDGSDTINDFDAANKGSVDKIVLGAGILPSDVTVSRVNRNLVLKINDPNNASATDQITIEIWDTGIFRIEQVQFDNGTVWTAANLTSLSMMGTSGADNMTLWGRQHVGQWWRWK